LPEYTPLYFDTDSIDLGKIDSFDESAVRTISIGISKDKK
jgi:hypothetical protein